jgi:hypothetical protein
MPASAVDHHLVAAFDYAATDLFNAGLKPAVRRGHASSSDEGERIRRLTRLAGRLDAQPPSIPGKAQARFEAGTSAARTADSVRGFMAAER